MGRNTRLRSQAKPLTRERKQGSMGSRKERREWFMRRGRVPRKLAWKSAKSAKTALKSPRGRSSRWTMRARPSLSRVLTERKKLSNTPKQPERIWAKPWEQARKRAPKSQCTTQRKVGRSLHTFLGSSFI